MSGFHGKLAKLHGGKGPFPDDEVGQVRANMNTGRLVRMKALLGSRWEEDALWLVEGLASGEEFQIKSRSLSDYAFENEMEMIAWEASL